MIILTPVQWQHQFEYSLLDELFDFLSTTQRGFGSAHIENSGFHFHEKQKKF